MAESLAHVFVENFQAHAQECVFRQRRGYRTESYTYGEILSRVSGVARDLHDHGVAKGDRVLVWGENGAEWVIVFWACVMRGVVVVPMDDAASSDFALRVAQKVDAKLLVVSRAHLGQVQGAGVQSLCLEDLVEKPRDAEIPIPEIRTKTEDILQIVFTSGTTAEPKGVVISHANVLANIAPLEKEMRAYLKYERFVHPLRFLNLLPLSHVFGQFLGMFLPPLLGGTVIFQQELRPAEIANTIRRERVSVLVCVPRVLQSLKQKVESDIEAAGRTDWFQRQFVAAREKHFLRRWWIFRSVRRQLGWKFWAFISGGASLNGETEEFWGRLGYAVIQGYGLTETTSLISVNHPFRLGKGSIGKVLAGREVKLAADGEILVKGGGVTSGYWEDRGNDQASEHDGWFRTGDLGALDAEGNLYFKGRKKEVIVTPAGMNVYPEDLETALRKQPEVKDCVVVGVDRDGNAEPCAVVILRSGAIEGAVHRANELLADYQRMRMWLEWPEEDFPRTSTFKPRRNAIAESVRATMRLQGETVADQVKGPLEELISRVTKRQVGNLHKDATLDSDLGLGSLDRVELLGALEDRYQVDLGEVRFSALRTVGDLERALRGDAKPAPSYHYPTWTLRWPVTWFRLAAHYLLMRPAILLLGWPRILGREHLSGFHGPMLVVANHIGDVDPGFILTALPARFRHRLATATGGEALEALRTPPSQSSLGGKIYDRVKWVLGVSLLNLFPLPREAGFRQSFAYAGQAVDRGYNVLVFPEGHHTTDGRMRDFRSGIGLLAQNLKIPVLPMRIDGLFEFKKAGKKFAPPWKINVRIGKPMTFSQQDAPEAIAAALQRAVSEL